MATPNISPKEYLPFPQPRLSDRAQSPQTNLVNEVASPEPLSEMPDSELFHKLKSWFEEGRDRTDKWRQEAQEAFDLCAGWQWDADDMRILREDNRPTVTFNRMDRNIDLINGMDEQNRDEVAFLPREQGDVGRSEVLSSAVQYIADETDSGDEKSDAFRDLCITGMGWTNTVMDYQDFEQGMPVESRVDCLQMYWDPHATKRNLKDTRWRARAVIMPTIEAKRMFPGIDNAMLHAPWAQITDDPSQPAEPDRQSYNYEDSPTIGRPPLLDRSTIVEIQWYEVSEVVVVQDLFTGERQELKRNRAETIMASFPGRYQGIPRPVKRYFRAFLGGMILQKMPLEKVKDFTFQPMTGKRDRRTGWYGMARLMADPQKWANKWLSQSMHILNTGAKNTMLYEEGAFLDGAQAERDITKPGAMITTATGAISGNQILQLPPTSLPPELGQHLLPFALQSIQDCVGVNQEQLGATGNANDANRAASLERERREAGITLMAHFFTAKRLFIKRQGRLLLRYMINFMNDGRLIRIQSEGNKQYAQLVIDNPDAIQYDIVVDDAPDSPNQRDKTWSTIIPMLPMMERLQPPPEVWIDVLRYSPLPAQLVEKLAQDIEGAEGQGDQEQVNPKDAAAAQADMAKLPAEIEKLQAETARLMADMERLQSQTLLNMAKAQESGAKIELDALEGIRETIAVDDARKANKLTTHEAA